MDEEADSVPALLSPIASPRTTKERKRKDMWFSMDVKRGDETDGKASVSLSYIMEVAKQVALAALNRNDHTIYFTQGAARAYFLMKKTQSDKATEDIRIDLKENPVSISFDLSRLADTDPQIPTLSLIAYCLINS